MAAGFEFRRGRESLASEGDLDYLAHQSAHDALMAILAKLGDFRGESRFTTWAYKFALYEAAVKARRRAWQGREVRLDPDAWDLLADRRQAPADELEMRELLTALEKSVESDLSPHQREVLVAVTIREVPIDVLAERLDTTRGALYKTVHDARRKLRASLSAQGFLGEAEAAEGRVG
jgi:RNA polymerase sigma-70 factor (ECF subfamily)